MSTETSIIIRTLNESRHLEKLLSGIQRQSYRDYEVILVDSGSTDGTLDIAGAYGARIHHIPQRDFTFGRSLNLGCEAAQGQYLAFASGHVWPVSNTWLENLVRPFDEAVVGMVYGRQRGTALNRISELRDLQENFGRTSRLFVDEPNGNNGNAAIRKDLWLEQPFDESLSGLEDIDWARKAQRKGYRVYYAADAAVYHVHEETLKQVYNRYLREAMAFKRMFPGRRFFATDLAKGIVYSVLRDVLYSARNRRYRKLYEVPGTRLAEFLGTYNGTRYYDSAVRQRARKLAVPQRCPSVVIDGPGISALRETDIRAVGNRDVLIRVGYIGVSPTDLAAAEGTLLDWSEAPISYPMVPGGEYSGIVVNLGVGVRSFRVGDKVAGDYAVDGNSGNTPAQDGGNSHRAAADSGSRNGHGAYTEFLTVPAEHIYKLPEDLPLSLGVIMQSLATCVAGLRSLGPTDGGSACVLGAGTMGNLCSQVLKSRGVRVTCVDDEPARLRLLHKHDVDTLPVAGDLGDYDYLIEAAGDRNALSRIADGTNPPARVLLLDSPYDLGAQGCPNSRVSGATKVYHTANIQRSDWEEAVRLVRRRAVHLDDLAAVVEPLDSYQKAWKMARSRKYVKVLLSAAGELEA